MELLIEYIRIYGFRGLKNIEVLLEPVTVLTGMNNTGKTSMQKALQIAFGNKQFVTPDDFYQSDDFTANEILVDVKIIPVNANGEKQDEFNDKWLEIFTDERLTIGSAGEQYLAFRTKVTIDPLTNAPKAKQFYLNEWPEFHAGETYWYNITLEKEISFHIDEMPFFYMDAQRDIIEDIKVRSSYLGKMLSKIEYSPDDIKEIEKQIKKLNEQAVSSSDILSNIETTLKELDTAMDNTHDGVDITPFPKKVRDLNKGVSIQYSDYSMDYHGMGTRSWSSLLTLKSFISLFAKNSEENSKAFFPILAIEEPEAHLHPNAQKKLFGQIANIKGQKIISTHSPYIAGTANLQQIRNFYKTDENVICGYIETSLFSGEDLRKIKRQVVNSRGELFFSKVAVFFEGETEEQALPIFLEKYFSKTSIEIGIDFIGVGGYGGYLPFLRVVEALNIPWFIFSDAENTADKKVKDSVIKQHADSHTNKPLTECVFFLDDNKDFEQQLIDDGYSDEIKQAIINTTEFHSEQHKTAKSVEINSYDNAKLYEIITHGKTQFGPAIADAIIASGKDIPPKVKELFDKIKETINF